jgi:hypothetical protein
MRTLRVFLPVALLALGVPGCVLFPQLKDKVVELATTGQVVTGFTAAGSDNTIDELKNINIPDYVDIRSTLDDAGIDASDVVRITVGGVAYRITRPEPGRVITSGSVGVSTGTDQSAGHTLVTSFTGNAGAATPWITATLDADGVTQLNDLLGAILDDLKNGTSNADQHITYHVSGLSTPTGTPTDFDYELRLTLSIVGKVKVKTLE